MNFQLRDSENSSIEGIDSYLSEVGGTETAAGLLFPPFTFYTLSFFVHENFLKVHQHEIEKIMYLFTSMIKFLMKMPHRH